MRTGTRRVTAVAAIVAAIGVVPIAPDSASAASCTSAGSSTLASTSASRVYRKASTGDIYGCLYSKNKRYRLVDVSSGAGTSSIHNGTLRLAGRYVGLATEDCGAIDCGSTIQVRNLKTGVRVHNTAAAPNDTVEEDDTEGPLVSDLELRKTNGSVAWIVQSQPAMGSATFEVRRSDSAGTSLVDTGGNIVPNSLALSGSSIFWLKGATSQTAGLN